MGSPRTGRRRDFLKAAGGLSLWYLGGCSGTPEAQIPPSQGSTKGPGETAGWPALSKLALARVKALGCEYGDIRLVETQNEIVYGEDRRIAAVVSRFDGGYGIRALYKGAWGFAA